jgi:hypothetical protein
MTLKSEVYEVTTDDAGNWYELRKRELYVRRSPSWNEYDTAGYALGSARGSIPFWIGDYINQGEDAFSERYSQALTHFGQIDYYTVANYASVCRRVPARIDRKRHRRDELSFSHHDAVAAQTHKKQAFWLERAIKEKLSSKELRALINPHPEGEGKSVHEALDDIILDLTELKAMSPAELRIHIDAALKELYDGRAEISKIHSKSKVPA